MTPKLTRRRFAQLALASTTVLAIAALPRKTTAYDTSLIYGVGVRSSKLILQTLDIPSLTVQDRSDLAGGIILDPSDQLTDFTSLGKDITLANGTTLAKGTFVVAVTSVKLSATGSYPTRLIFLGSSPTTLTLAELGKQFILNSALGTNDGGLFVLINKLNGLPPFKIDSVDPQTGQLTFMAELDQSGGRQASNVTQCADGRILAIATDQLGNLNLVQLDPVQGKLSKVQQLSFSPNDGSRSINSLTCSPSGQLFVLSTKRYESINSLFAIDPNTGLLILLREFPVIQNCLCSCLSN